MESLIPVFFAMFFALVVGLIIWGFFQNKKRMEGLRAWIAERRFSFTEASDYSFDSRYPEFESLQEGKARYAYDIIEGIYRERAITGFDYHYETTSTDSKGKTETHHHYFSAVIVEAGLPLKPLYIRSENMFDKIGEFMGLDDIDFESAEFSRKFHVTSPEKRWAFDVLHQEAIEFLLASPQFTIDVQPQRIMISHGGVFSVEEYQAALDVVSGLLDRLPKSVLRELKESN